MRQDANADQLRQRVGFALSEIFVISDQLDELWNQPVGMMNYHDMLLKGAFENFRELLFNVAMHPCMGIYLNHLGNEKGDPGAGTFADENFAREIMQLSRSGFLISTLTARRSSTRTTSRFRLTTIVRSRRWRR